MAARRERSIKERFDAAVAILRTLPKDGPLQPSNTTKLRQSTEGPCTKPKPSFWDAVGRAKWEAWSVCGKMTSELAMQMYIQELQQFVESLSRTPEIDDFLKKIGPYVEDDSSVYPAEAGSGRGKEEEDFCSSKSSQSVSEKLSEEKMEVQSGGVRWEGGGGWGEGGGEGWREEGRGEGWGEGGGEGWREGGGGEGWREGGEGWGEGGELGWGQQGGEGGGGGGANDDLETDHPVQMQISGGRSDSETSEDFVDSVQEPPGFDLTLTPQPSHAPWQSGGHAPQQSGDYAPQQSGDYAPQQSGDHAPWQSGDYTPSTTTTTTVLQPYPQPRLSSPIDLSPVPPSGQPQVSVQTPQVAPPSDLSAPPPTTGELRGVLQELLSVHMRLQSVLQQLTSVISPLASTSPQPHPQPHPQSQADSDEIKRQWRRRVLYRFLPLAISWPFIVQFVVRILLKVFGSSSFPWWVFSLATFLQTALAVAFLVFSTHFS